MNEGTRTRITRRRWMALLVAGQDLELEPYLASLA
jgi:hypothetical protein